MENGGFTYVHVYDKVTAVSVGGVLGLALAAQQVGGHGSGLPRGLPAASRTYHLRTMFPLFAINVDIGETSLTERNKFPQQKRKTKIEIEI